MNSRKHLFPRRQKNVNNGIRGKIGLLTSIGCTISTSPSQLAPQSPPPSHHSPHPLAPSRPFSTMTSTELDYAILATPPPSRRTRPATVPSSVSGAVTDDGIEYSPLSPPAIAPEEPVERQPWSRRGRKTSDTTEYMVLAPPGTVPARKPRPGQAKPVPVRVPSDDAIETIESQPLAPSISPATNLPTNPPPPSVRFDVPTGILPRVRNRRNNKSQGIRLRKD